MTYPFIPKSNKKLSSGDYWVTKLSNKSYAVGVVIDVPPADLKLTREIVVGLLNWNGKINRLINNRNLKDYSCFIRVKTPLYSSLIRKQVIIPPFFGNQIIMGALFGNTAIFNH